MFDIDLRRDGNHRLMDDSIYQDDSGNECSCKICNGGEGLLAFGYGKSLRAAASRLLSVSPTFLSTNLAIVLSVIVSIILLVQTLPDPPFMPE